MSIKSKARRRGIAGYCKPEQHAIDVHGWRKSVICGLSRYNHKDRLIYTIYERFKEIDITSFREHYD